MFCEKNNSGNIFEFFDNIPTPDPLPRISVKECNNGALHSKYITDNNVSIESLVMDT